MASLTTTWPSSFRSQWSCRVIQVTVAATISMQTRLFDKSSFWLEPDSLTFSISHDHCHIGLLPAWKRSILTCCAWLKGVVYATVALTVSSGGTFMCLVPMIWTWFGIGFCFSELEALRRLLSECMVICSSASFFVVVFFSALFLLCNHSLEAMPTLSIRSHHCSWWPALRSGFYPGSERLVVLTWIARFYSNGMCVLNMYVARSWHSVRLEYIHFAYFRKLQGWKSFHNWTHQCVFLPSRLHSDVILTWPHT